MVLGIPLFQVQTNVEFVHLDIGLEAAIGSLLAMALLDGHYLV